MATSTPALPPPVPDQAYMHVSALHAGIIHIPTDLVIQGQPHTHQACPSLSFYLKHSASDKHFIFDLGLRRDWRSYSPAVQQHYYESGLMPCEVPQDVAESCVKGGLDPAKVERIVISHLHFDHIGDHAPFTTATWVLGGEGKSHLTDGYPGNPAAHFLTDAVPVDRARFLDDADFDVAIGPFPRAHDLFGDGAAYIIDTPGHCAGHVTLLARTSADGAWMFFGGDIAHDTRLLTDATAELATTRENGAPYCMHRDPVRARIDIGRARELVRLPRVEFVIAHDWKWLQENEGKAFLPERYVPKV